MSDVVVGADGVARCPWAVGSEMMAAYHDTEWGVPLHGEGPLFERISLEAFQSGLSWSTILRKREGFRAAFSGFDADAVAALTDADVERLMADERIVRNRAKIEATRANAAAVVALRTGGGLDELVWSHAPAPGRTGPRRLGDLPARTPGSVALAKDLKAHGFRFVGPTTAYALMQAAGLVDDHLAGCHRRGAG
ncbi:MAG: DNA-3-methyladenine glycosylase I [Acidimicrobiia bacterium]